MLWVACSLPTADPKVVTDGDRADVLGHIARVYPWLTATPSEVERTGCGLVAGELCVDVRYPPHWAVPRASRRWLVSCRLTADGQWRCTYPSELTAVHLAEGDRGSLAFDVSVPEATAALSAVLQASRGAGIQNPLDRDDPLRALAPDALQAVLREPSCADVLVLARRPRDGALLELCVEPEACEETALCPLTVRIHGERLERGDVGIEPQSS